MQRKQTVLGVSKSWWTRWSVNFVSRASLISHAQSLCMNNISNKIQERKLTSIQNSGWHSASERNPLNVYEWRSQVVGISKMLATVCSFATKASARISAYLYLKFPKPIPEKRLLGRLHNSSPSIHFQRTTLCMQPTFGKHLFFETWGQVPLGSLSILASWAWSLTSSNVWVNCTTHATSGTRLINYACHQNARQSINFYKSLNKPKIRNEQLIKHSIRPSRKLQMFLSLARI